MWVRLIGGLVGLGFVGVLTIAFLVNLSAYYASPPEPSAEHEFHKPPKHLALASDGPFGKFDEQQLQRGFQVYTEVCAACHGLGLVAFRNLRDLGYTEAEIKKIASDWKIQVPSINPDTGEPATRKAVPADLFPQPFANETAARAANNGANPPDLSLITKARQGGASYIYSLLTGYQAPPAKLLKEFPASAPGPGLNYNPYFANLNLAMPQPIVADGQVTYADGTKASVDQMSKDVSAFLVWTAEPNLQRRHAAGLAVVIFLLFATVLGYLAYRQLWSSAKRQVRDIGPLRPGNQAKSRSAKAKAGIRG